MTSQDISRPLARAPRGFPDRRGASLAAERAIVEKISKVYDLWGFEPLETSAFEYADALGKFLPDADRPNEGVFALQDEDEQWMALRYDLTAPLARFVAENYDALPKPYRRWATGSVWRNEKPGPGRFRQFTQLDADTVGAAGAAADAEMIALATEVYLAAGLEAEEVVVCVNTRRLLDGVMEAAGIAGADRLIAMRAIDKLDRMGPQGVAALLGKGRKDESGDFTKGAGLESGQIDRVLGFVQAGAATRAKTLETLVPLVGDTQVGRAGLAELEEIGAVLDGLGVSEAAARFDPTIVRGLEYYTGPVFEAQLTTAIEGENGQLVRFGSVGGGGRYDDLVARFRGESVPATGFSVGVSRLVSALHARDAASRPGGPVVILVMDRDAIGSYFAMANELRTAGIATEVYLGGSGMKAQMKYADKRGAPVAIIEGSDERAKGVVTIKDLNLGAALSKEVADNDAWRKGRPAQIEASRSEIVRAVQAMLEANAQ